MKGTTNSICFRRKQKLLDSFENISNVTHDQNDISLISSDPSPVCFCSEGRKNFSTLSLTAIRTNHLHPLYPGQIINIPAVPVGQNFGTVAGSEYAQYLKKSHTQTTYWN